MREAERKRTRMEREDREVWGRREGRPRVREMSRTGEIGRPAEGSREEDREDEEGER